MEKSWINESEKKQREKQKRMECPKCQSKMLEVGALIVALHNDKNNINGLYCANCYSEWIAATFQKFIDPEERVSNLILNA